MYGKSDRYTRMLYIFRTQEHMSEAITSPGGMMPMYMAHFALELSEDIKTCKVVKDRFGLFNPSTEFNTKKMLKIVEILMED